MKGTKKFLAHTNLPVDIGLIVPTPCNTFAQAVYRIDDDPVLGLSITVHRLTIVRIWVGALSFIGPNDKNLYCN